MSATDIIKHLYSHFENYEYKLNNTYVFDWESDFFAMSKSGYFIECEVKISRSDFFVDFKKEKHRLFQDVCAGKMHLVRKDKASWRRPQEAFLGWVEVAQLNTWFSENRWHSGYKNGKWGYWVNDYGKIELNKREIQIWAQHTDVSITPIEKVPIPNQFYYVVPEGLIKLEELPKYAGLITISRDALEGLTYKYLKVVKKAPYVHKRPVDLTATLLKKFYNLWQFKVPRETKLKIINGYAA